MVVSKLAVAANCTGGDAPTFIVRDDYKFEAAPSNPITRGTLPSVPYSASRTSAASPFIPTVFYPALMVLHAVLVAPCCRRGSRAWHCHELSCCPPLRWHRAQASNANSVPACPWPARCTARVPIPHTAAGRLPVCNGNHLTIPLSTVMRLDTTGTVRYLLNEALELVCDSCSGNLGVQPRRSGLT